MLGAKRVSFTVGQDLNIVADSFGKERARPVLLAHGGGQTRHAWQACGMTLGLHGYHALSLDLRGHGESDWAPDGDYNVERFAEDILSIADTFPEAPVLVGASLGGMAGLIAQGEYVRAGRRGFSALILVDITPRMNMDGVQKILGFMSSNLDTGFASLEEAADAIAQYLPNRPRPKNLNGLAKNLRLKDGRYFWHWDPRFISGAHKPRSSQEPERLEHAARCVNVPTLLVRGNKSELVDTEAVRVFSELVPHHEFVDVADAGHMVAGDSNDTFNGAIIEFLNRTCSKQPAAAD